MSQVVLLGPPGVGKGTQAAALSRALGIPAISTGDMFRHQIESGTPLGLELQAIVASGGLVPDATTSRVVAARLAADDTDGGFILDGYPRTAGQVDDLDRMLAAADVGITRVVLLLATEDVLVSRLARRGAEQHRADDAPDVVRARLRTYVETIAPVVERYEQRDLLSRIDADRPPEAVAAALLDIVSAGVGGGMLS